MNPAELFTPDHITRLQHHFGSVERVDPCSETWLMLKDCVQEYPLALLTQIAGADIKWLSMIAKVELDKRKQNK